MPQFILLNAQEVMGAGMVGTKMFSFSRDLAPVRWTLGCLGVTHAAHRLSQSSETLSYQDFLNSSANLFPWRLRNPPRNSFTNNRKVWHKHLFSERVDSQKTSFAHRWLILLAAPNPERLIHTYTICSLILFDKSIVCLWIFIHQFFYFIHSIFFCRLHEKYLDNLFNSKLKIPICWRVNIHKRIAAQLWMTKKPQPITLAALIYKALSFLASSSIKCNQSWN